MKEIFKLPGWIILNRESKRGSVTVKASLSKIFPKAAKPSGAAPEHSKDLKEFAVRQAGFLTSKTEMEKVCTLKTVKESCDRKRNIANGRRRRAVSEKYKPLELKEMKFTSSPAFSLVEMLMALLVASLLMAALAPVMTKRLNDNVNVSDVGGKAMQEMTQIFNYNDEYCSEIDEENNVCKGEFTIPQDAASVIKVSLIGAGGGGGAGTSTGYIEYTTSGEHYFVVPQGVNELNVTMAGGGAGGSAGGYTESTTTFSTPGVFSWDSSSNPALPDAIKGRYVKVMGCGGGGGGGGAAPDNIGFGGAGGSGGYRKNPIMVKIDKNALSVPYQVGGGGGGAGNSYLGAGLPGECGGGGDGASDDEVGSRVVNTCPVQYGGKSAGWIYPETYWTAYGGYPGGGNAGLRYSEYSVIAKGGAGADGGDGGDSGKSPVSGLTMSFTGGGGGGKYGGGGGGFGCTGPAGGGGGPTYFNDVFIASGGGGGGGLASSSTVAGEWACPGGGGGGGGGQNGGRGGNGGDGTPNTGVHYDGYAGGGGYPNGIASSGALQGWSADTDGYKLYGADYCRGGRGGNNSSTWFKSVGETGKNGMLKITYLDYGKGGAGGASGQWIENRIVKVKPGEKLAVKVGAGGQGGVSAYIDSNGTVVAASASNTAGTRSYIKDSENNVLITTEKTTNAISYTVTSLGGAGAKHSNAGCNVGVGGAASSKNGGNAQGYGGCGGGGGYGLTDGGNGAPGYVKITWNPGKTGTGGGGASGNYIDKRIVTVNPGAIVPFQIGRGGKGGIISAVNTKESNLSGSAFEPGQKGGDTIFGTGNESTNNFNIAAGGGFGGYGAKALNDGSVVNGFGGEIASLCKIGIKDFLICTSSLAGKQGENVRGGKGADSKFGEGAIGGTYGGNVQAAENIGAGGGGAGVFNAGRANEGTESTVNQSRGGAGGNGQIILEWYMK